MIVCYRHRQVNFVGLKCKVVQIDYYYRPIGYPRYAVALEIKIQLNRVRDPNP